MSDLAPDERSALHAALNKRLSEIDALLDDRGRPIDPVTILDWVSLHAERSALRKLLAEEE